MAVNLRLEVNLGLADVLADITFHFVFCFCLTFKFLLV